jgi:RNA polymerase sigma factor (TIGR02999 family)
MRETETLVCDNRQGNGQQLLVLLYNEIRSIARQRLSGERTNHTLNTTALVHEVYLRIAHSGQQFHSESQFAAAASQMMRRILVDHARAHRREKRGGSLEIVQLSSLAFDIGDARMVDVESLDEALTDLAQIDFRQARVVEMRFFGGLTTEEIAAVLGVSSKTVKRDWATARAWLRASLQS